MAHHERIACSACKQDVCMCETVSKGPLFPYVCEDCANPPRQVTLPPDGLAALTALAQHVK